MTSNQLTTLLLVRHGQSEWNAQGRWQGQADSPLSELGKKQAFEAASAVGAVDLIVSSPQSRALDTARIISEGIGVGPVGELEGLRERSAGEWSGLTHDEIEQKWPGWIEQGRRPPAFESDASLDSRVWAALSQVVAASGGADVLVLCHGGVIRHVERSLGAESSSVPNLAGRIVTYDGDRFFSGDRVELLAAVETPIDQQRQVL